MTECDKSDTQLFPIKNYARHAQSVHCTYKCRVEANTLDVQTGDAKSTADLHHGNGVVHPVDQRHGRGRPGSTYPQFGVSAPFATVLHTTVVGRKFSAGRILSICLPLQI